MWVTTLTSRTTEVFVTHANAPLTPEGRRRLAVLVVDRGWSLRRVAERFQCSPATAKRWVGRYRAGLPLSDRSSRPHSSPNRLSRKTEHRIVSLRFTRRWGPHRIAYHLRLHRSTVGRVLARYGIPKLANTAWKVKQLHGGILEWTSPLGDVYSDTPSAPTVHFRPVDDDPPAPF